jgi:hypothetical protein
VREEAGRRVPDDAARAQFWSDMSERVFASPPLKTAEWEALLLRELGSRPR